MHHCLKYQDPMGMLSNSQWLLHPPFRGAPLNPGDTAVTQYHLLHLLSPSSLQCQKRRNEMTRANTRAPNANDRIPFPVFE